MGNTATQQQKDENLSLAAEKGETKKVDELLKAGADPNSCLVDGERRQRTSLHRAAKTKNNVDVLTKLLTCIRDVDATDDEGNTALHLAAGYYNNAAVVQTLLHARPNCKIQNNKGQTALHSAVINGSDWKVVELLLIGDSDPNIEDFNGNTPLHLCAGKKGSHDMVPGILLRFGANPNAKNEQGQTPLHIASRDGNKIVLLLLKYHAKVRLRDKDGNKPSDLAASEEIKRILDHEEESLKERTVRIETSLLYSSFSSKDSNRNYYGTRHDVCTGMNNGIVTPAYTPIHFWADDVGMWKAYGGEGVIHLPDKSDVVVPPQAVPQGTSIKINITPAESNTSKKIPEFDFDLYDIDLKLKFDLPGSMFASEMRKESDFRKRFPSMTLPLAFTGFCADGKYRWTSCREVAYQRNGVVGLNFDLKRKRREPMIYKVPRPNRQSTTEIFIRSPIKPDALSSFMKQENVSNLENMTPPELSLSRSSSSSISEISVKDIKEKTTFVNKPASERVREDDDIISTSSSTDKDSVSFESSLNRHADSNEFSEEANLFNEFEVVVAVRHQEEQEEAKNNKEENVSKNQALDAISDFLGSDPNLNSDVITSSDDEDTKKSILDSNPERICANNSEITDQSSGDKNIVMKSQSSSSSSNGSDQPNNKKNLSHDFGWKRLSYDMDHEFLHLDKIDTQDANVFEKSHSVNSTASSDAENDQIGSSLENTNLLSAEGSGYVSFVNPELSLELVPGRFPGVNSPMDKRSLNERSDLANIRSESSDESSEAGQDEYGASIHRDCVVAMKNVDEIENQKDLDKRFHYDGDYEDGSDKIVQIYPCKTVNCDKGEIVNDENVNNEMIDDNSEKICYGSQSESIQNDIDDETKENEEIEIPDSNFVENRTILFERSESSRSSRSSNGTRSEVEESLDGDEREMSKSKILEETFEVETENLDPENLFSNEEDKVSASSKESDKSSGSEDEDIEVSPNNDDSYVLLNDDASTSILTYGKIIGNSDIIIPDDIPNEPRYEHPIDPALATIEEDGEDQGDTKQALRRSRDRSSSSSSEEEMREERLI